MMSNPYQFSRPGGFAVTDSSKANYQPSPSAIQEQAGIDALNARMATNDTLVSGHTAALAKINWVDIVKDYGAISGQDCTTAINNAIASGKLLRVPSGIFTFSGTQPTNYVVYFGEGIIVDNTGVPIPRFVKDLGTSYLTTNNLSYIGVVNHSYFGDNATRLYVIPKDVVTTGVGGAIKIFGDAYHLGQDYRDMGIYFHANQNGDAGSNGKGAFWINGKVFPGGTYDGKNPDIGFSFQDGAVVAGRISLVNNRAFFVIGSAIGKYAQNFNGIGMEIQTDTIMLKDKIFRFEDEAGFISTGFRYNSTTQKFEILVKGTVVASFSPTGATITGVGGGGFPTAYVGITNGATTIDASTGGTFVINNSAPTSITDLTSGVSGQSVCLVINDTNTTIVSGTAIKLAGGTNFKPATLLSNITLKRLGSSWVETARTVL